MLRLDHLAVVAETLQEGVSYVEETLGARMVAGGKHPVMGTHNQLMGLANGLYLEVIAIDPAVEAPPHPRWFDLDRFSGQPRIGNWIARTEDLHGELRSLTPQAGEPLALNRGDLSWKMAVPTDGVLPFDGAFPAIIEWEGQAHPVSRLPQSGLQLLSFEVHHPAVEQLQMLALADPIVSFVLAEKPGFRAVFDTPNGERNLS
ncbi:MAG: VOC family protein [Pseudoruegeria sp.]